MNDEMYAPGYGPPSPLQEARQDPLGALVLLVEACERGEPNLRVYLDAAHAAISRGGCPDCEKYAMLAGRFQSGVDRYREALEQAEAKREIAEANLAITQENLSNADAVLGRLIEDCDKAEAEGVHVLYTNHVRSLAAVGGDPE